MCLKSLFSCKFPSIIQFWWYTVPFGSSSTMLQPCSMGRLWVGFIQDCTSGSKHGRSNEIAGLGDLLPLPSPLCNQRTYLSNWNIFKSQKLSSEYIYCSTKAAPCMMKTLIPSLTLYSWRANLDTLYKTSIYWLRLLIHWPIHWSGVTGNLVSPTLE